MQQTTNYALKKIELTDSPPDITVLNSNFDTIDAELKEREDAVATHTAETVSKVIAITRDISLTGVQTISAPFKIKSATIIACISGTKAMCEGMFSEDGTQRSIYKVATTDLFIANTAAIILATTAIDNAQGSIQNITLTTFEINWAKNNAPIGTATMFILVSTH